MEAQTPASPPAAAAPAGGAAGAAQVTPIIDLLLTVGYIDGLFHRQEQAFVQQYIDSVLLLIEQSAGATDAPGMRGMWRAHFRDLYRRLDAEISVLADEVVASEPDNYVPTRLRVRAVEIFRGLPPHDQTTALELIEALINADGMVTPPEEKLYQELTSYFTSAPTPIPAASPAEPTAKMKALEAAPGPGADAVKLLIGAPVQYDLFALSHPLLDPLEQTYSPHPVERQSQIDWDYQLIQQAIGLWQRQRAAGNGRLAGVTHPAQIPEGPPFLDGYVYAHRPTHPLEVVVLGDLHGCYSCLKAALMQSNFIQRAWAHQWDPQTYPDIKLVLLGDYIDRGLYSFDGVLRTALQLFVALPDSVILLRGNHEFLTWFEGRVISFVHPAEALASIAPHVPMEMLDAYRVLFEHMPTSFACDRTLFVHGGIPRDDTFAERYHGLSNLNDPDIRFQMMWSDPAKTQHIPVDLQRKNPRFSFGHNQFKRFMERSGFNTMIRGHEKIDRGFETVYDMGDHQLINLFSAGGHNNADLPPESSYRRVTPMGLTIQYGHGQPRATPWPLQYHVFNYPPHNGLYRPHPVLEFRYV